MKSNFWKKWVDHRQEGTLATIHRRKRFHFFLNCIASLPRPIKLLDAGGEPVFWKLMGCSNHPDFQITVINLLEFQSDASNITCITGDVTNMNQFQDAEFDMVFSNSVIEHLTCWERQQRMALEVQRVGKNYFIQTPNRNFPLEPHFLVPFFQFFPVNLQIWMLQHFSLGWYEKISNIKYARQLLESHRLLYIKELKLLFPHAQIYYEKIFGLTKSMVAYSHFP